MRVGLHWNREGSGKAKVRNFEVVVVVSENILWLQIAVHNPITVDSMDSTENLLHVVLHNLPVLGSLGGVDSQVLPVSADDAR